MKNELFYQSFAILLMGFWPIYFKFNQHFSIAYYSIYALLLMVSAYYFCDFTGFLKSRIFIQAIQKTIFMSYIMRSV